MAEAGSSAEDLGNRSPEDIKFSSLIEHITFHPTKDVISAASIDGDIYLWSLSTEGNNNQLLELTHHKKACRATSFSADGELLFSVSKDKSLKVVDLNVGAVSHKINKAHEGPINSLEVVDNYLVATGDEDGTVKVWDFRRANAIMELKETEECISSLTIAHDKKHLLATSGEGVLCVFNVRAKRLELKSEPYDSDLLCLSILKSNSKVAVGSQDGAINIFNFGEWGNISDRFPGHPFSVDCMVGVTDSIVCTGSEDGIIRAVNILPNRFVGIVGQHDNFPIDDVALSRDSQWLASCSEETVKFWNVGYLHSLEVSDRKKAKRKRGEKHLPSSRNQDFFADLDL